MFWRTRFPHSLAELEGMKPPSDSRAWVRPGPKRFLGIGLGRICNFTCPACWYHAPSDEGASVGGSMPLATLERLFVAAGPLAMASFALEGEPFLHPRIFEAIAMAGHYADQTLVCTNASRIGMDEAKRLAEVGVSRVVASIDGADEETYAFMRRGGCLKDFVDAASLLAERLGPSVEFYAVCCAQNLASLERLPQLARACGVGRASFGILRPHALPDKEGLAPPSSEALRAFLPRLVENAASQDISLDFSGFSCDAETMLLLAGLLRPGDQPAVATVPPCPIPWLHVAVLSDMRLIPCCGDFKPEPLEELSFDGIFNHRYLVLLRTLLLRHGVVNACRTCRSFAK